MLQSDARRSQRTTHRMATPDLMREIIADERHTLNTDLALGSTNGHTRTMMTKYKVIQPSYIQLTRNKMNNPELFID